MTPDRVRAAERELIATMLRDHADARVNDAPAYAEAIYDAEALVRGGRPVYAPGPTADSAAAEVRQLRAAIAELDAAWVCLDAVFPRGGDLRAAAVKRLDAARTAAGVRATSD